MQGKINERERKLTINNLSAKICGRSISVSFSLNSDELEEAQRGNQTVAKRKLGRTCTPTSMARDRSLIKEVMREIEAEGARLTDGEIDRRLCIRFKVLAGDGKPVNAKTMGSLRRRHETRLRHLRGDGHTK